MAGPSGARFPMADFLHLILRGIIQFLLEAINWVPFDRWEGASPAWGASVLVAVAVAIGALVAAIATGRAWLYSLTLGAAAVGLGLAIAAAAWQGPGRGDRTR